jgi:hypothetical protein
MDNMTPSRIGRCVKELLLRLGLNLEPVYVPVATEVNARVNECLDAVTEKVNTSGGTIEYGWNIWKAPLLTEAEFHAVWKSPAGTLIDVTPKEPPEERILFVPDGRNLWADRKNVDNIRVNNTGSPIVDDFISICEAMFGIRNKGDRSKTLHVVLEDEEAALYKYLESIRAPTQIFALQGGHPGSPCYCGSGRPYYECHKEDLMSLFAHLRELGAELA